MREQILSIIEKNSRINLHELAVILGMEEADVVNEMEQMEKEGIICGYHTLIDWEKTSVEKVSALIEVRVTPQRGKGFDSIAERIYKYPEVHAVYLISGGYDLLVSLEGKTLKEVSNFVSDKLSTLDTVISTATHFILKKYKDHGTILEKKESDERMQVTPPIIINFFINVVLPAKRVLLSVKEVAKMISVLIRQPQTATMIVFTHHFPNGKTLGFVNNFT